MNMHRAPEGRHNWDAAVPPLRGLPTSCPSLPRADALGYRCFAPPGLRPADRSPRSVKHPRVKFRWTYCIGFGMLPVSMVHGTATRNLNRFSGRAFAPEELALIGEVVESCSGLSRSELAHTVCELLGWQRPSGRLKAVECGELLERLECMGVWRLPAKQPRRPVGSRTRVPVTVRGDQGGELLGEVGDIAPIDIEAVETEDQRLLFRELVGRHHYLGHRVPFGAHLRYLVFASRPERTVVGCVQFSSPAWRIAVRDAWIGWDDTARERNLQRVVSNSRFLILPWVRVKNLASRVLSLAMRRLRLDWPRRYGVEVLLAETLVDTSRYTGHCYRAANWIFLGETSGRGRMDREHLRHGAAPKAVLIYPLLRDAARLLREA